MRTAMDIWALGVLPTLMIVLAMAGRLRDLHDWGAAWLVAALWPLFWPTLAAVRWWNRRND